MGDIIADVRARGDAALIELSARFDRAKLTQETLRVPFHEIDDAYKSADAGGEERAARSRRRGSRPITSARFRSMRASPTTPARTLGWRWTPLQSVGLYVPGGTASYPSSVLMNAVPARVAGVSRIVMVTPAAGAKINPLTLAAAKLAGISEIYRVGGAQAVAALAYGTATIAPVDKIVGPGNAYVAAAKRAVFGRVGIDSIAGPSEILVVADGANDPAWIAADLLSQAEHDASSQSILITDDARIRRPGRGGGGRAIEGASPPRDRASLLARSWRDHRGGKSGGRGGAGRSHRARASGDRDRGAASVPSRA